jgi:hypothetical protein
MPQTATITIPSKFNGPPGSANGGYSCGLVASVLGEGAEVTLRHPPPLDTPLLVTVDGQSAEVRDGETLIATAEVVAWDLEVPPAPSLPEAEIASLSYAGLERHEFPTCFACGVDRDDGLRIWPGPMAGRDLVATPWEPTDDLAVDGDHLRPEIVWAALDCPGAWVEARSKDDPMIVLGRMAARIAAPIGLGDTLVAYAWQLGSEGRKSFSGTALADREGTVLAYARQTWIASRGS